MKRIDPETVRRILDTADIVDVVSEFVSLKRRGANYIGLCPFHNERTPSFSVSRARGICKCFSCGEGGSAINFLMKVESLSYGEALRWLARKYNIEIREEEVSEEERLAQSERETMLAVNDMAMHHFEHNLMETDDGRAIGLAYFRERGINDAMIRRFHLGYSMDRRDDLLEAAKAAGFGEQYLVATGLCVQPDDGRKPYDRFRARVMYPVQGISGKVVAFGGRTLRSDKTVAKYVNSPESIIYSKSRELYGLYQAKNAIARKDKCILVEGYMDVISMHQAGVENVVASSGTSLTDGQVRLIHRFTRNVTVIYDSDPAGIKASLRGIDMLLSEDLDVKVLLLPDGDDPDSFAQHHSSAEVEQYLAEHEEDFISFKIGILLDDAHSDPVKRSRVVTDILGSIAVIPNEITRQMYLQEVSRRFSLDLQMLALETQRIMARNAEERANRARREGAIATLTTPLQGGAEGAAAMQTAVPAATQPTAPTTPTADEVLRPYEEQLARYLVRYGLCDSQCSTLLPDGTTAPMTVVEYIGEELAMDDLRFSDPVCARIYNEVDEMRRTSWSADLEREQAEARREYEQQLEAGRDAIRRDPVNVEARDTALVQQCEEHLRDRMAAFAARYAERMLCSSPDDDVRRLATALASDRHHLSKIHNKYSHVLTEMERLPDLLQRAVNEYKDAIVGRRIVEIGRRISAAGEGDADELAVLMGELQQLTAIKRELAHFLGDRIVAPLPTGRRR